MPPETFDEKSARLSQAAAAEAERDRLYREQAARDATISWQRLLAILRGEAPTRESNEEWAARQRGMLPMPPARTFDENFNTVLTAPEEQAFQAWKAQNAPRDSGADYDLRGAFKAGLQPDQATQHWPDTFKKPNHPTFSNESMYAPFGNPGHWNGETYVPPAPNASTGMTAPGNYANPGINSAPVMAPTLPAGMLPVYEPSPRPFSPDSDYIPAFIRG